MKPWLIVAVGLALVTTGCNNVKEIMGLMPQGDPSVELRSAEPRWLLIKNPRYGDVPSEPEYIWVEEDKVPTTLTTLIRGQSAIIATPEVVAKYGSPPGGGKISPRQGVPYAAEPAASSATRLAVAPPAEGGVRPVANTPAPPEPKRGFVVYVDTTRIVIDLTAEDGVHAGTIVSVRRNRIPIVHPVTGEVLGELDEEVGTARVTEMREKFSVAEIQSVAAGLHVEVRDRVVPK